VGSELSGRVALVTGCGRARGIGRLIALTLAGAGADVAVSDLRRAGVPNEGEPAGADASHDGIDALVAELQALGRRAVAVTGDVADVADAERMVSQAAAELGPVDILVNNAGAPHGPDRVATWLAPPDAFDSVMRTNARGVFVMSGAVIRQLLPRGVPGRIINIASVAGLVGYPARGAYCASKFAVIGLTQVMAQELAPHGITVNAVCPGAIATDRNAATQRRGAAGVDAGAATASGSPVGRLGEPRDIARTVAYLADPQADYVTGQALVVDGGLYMH
jgi:NAD(P)-dependent dehydrogenase (short-subunit alcohol dehydrogenase family)